MTTCCALIIVAVLIYLGFYLARNCITDRSDGFTSGMIKKLSKFDGRMPGTIEHYNSYLYLLNQVKTLPGIRELSWAPNYTQKFVKFEQDSDVLHRNIVFSIPGRSSRPSSTVVIMAHYDHIGPGFPGSNDNGSGVFGLLKVAEHMSHLATVEPPSHTIIFALTDSEESDQRGSKELAARIPSPAVAINIDTIGGYPTGSPIYIANNGNYSQYFIKTAQEKNINVSLIDIIPGRSDISIFLNKNGTRCVEFGVPLGEYHTVTDTYENLNIENMTTIIRLATELVENINY